MTFGAQKYAPGNWANGSGFEWSRLYDAMQRHLNAFWAGDEYDEESGLLHLYHAACMLAFLASHYERAHGTDDREKIGVKRRRATASKAA